MSSQQRRCLSRRPAEIAFDSTHLNLQLSLVSTDTGDRSNNFV
ncbi:hypothetical protein [Microcoleus sp. herbarium12]